MRNKIILNNGEINIKIYKGALTIWPVYAYTLAAQKTTIKLPMLILHTEVFRAWVTEFESDWSKRLFEWHAPDERFWKQVLTHFASLWIVQ